MGAMCFTLKTLFRICLSAVPEVSDHMEFCSFKWMIEFFYQWLKYINNNGSCSATLSWDIYAPSSSYLAASKNKIPKLNYEFSVTVCIWLWLCFTENILWIGIKCLVLVSILVLYLLPKITCYMLIALKMFEQRCDIGDASRGSLSSYAYILMVLYFLQQREPPVIPVLQEVNFQGTKLGWKVLTFLSFLDIICLWY